MDKEMELHISIYDGDDGIRYIKEEDFINTIKNIQETIQINYQLIDKLQERIDKTIKYIEKDYIYIQHNTYNKLLEILKGEE